MKKNQTALIRQTTIFNRLNEGETLNVKVLAEEFGVSLRTIQKDFNERLNTMYDIVDLGHGNYAFAEGYRFKGADDEDEKVALSLMKSLQHNALPQMDAYINSTITSVKNYEEMFLFNLDFEPIDDLENFKIILKAIQWKFGISFVYTRLDGKTAEVTVHPYRLANFNNFWYLIAYDLKHEKIKTYYLGKISKLQTLYENFTDDPKVNEEINAAGNIASAWYKPEVFEVTLSVKGEARRYLERHHPQNVKIVESTDEKILLQFSYYNKAELFTFVKKWLPDIRIEDTALQNELIALLKAYTE